MKFIIALLAFFLTMPITHASDSESFEFGDAVITHYSSDGSGSLQPKDVLKVGDSFEWHYRVSMDRMSDSVKAHILRSGYYQTEKNGRRLSSDLGLFFVMDGSTNSANVLCVMGHNFPGRSAMIRIDQNKSYTTLKNGCLPLSSKLLKELRQGLVVSVRGYKWPHDYTDDADVDLDNFGTIFDFVNIQKKKLKQRR